MLPALAAWGSALVLVSCSAAVGTLVAAVITVAAGVTVWHTRPAIRPRMRRGSQDAACTTTRQQARPMPRRSTPLTTQQPIRAWSEDPYADRAPFSAHGPSSVTAPRQLRADRARTHTTSEQHPWRNIVIASLIAAAASSASVALRIHALTTGPVADLAARNATVTARIAITDDPRRRPQHHQGPRHFSQDRYVVPATLKTIQSPPGATTRNQSVDVPVVVFAGGREWGALLPSQQVEVTGRLARANPGDLQAAILLVRGPPRVLTAPSPLQTVAGSLRAGLRTAADVLPPGQRGLLPGLVVGDVSRMDPQVSADLKETGLNHLNAVSGANLAIVAGATLALSRLLRLSLPVRAVLAALAMLCFAVVARPSPSVLRALLMGLAACVALATGRAKDGFAALSATVLLLTLFAPELARSYGFALSVAATAGILLLAPRWRDRWSRTTTNKEGDGERRPPEGSRPRGRRLLLPRWLAEAVAVPAAAQVAVTPVLVLMSGQVTPVALLANLLVAPAVAPATLLGFGAALVAPLWPDVGALLVVPAGYAVGWIITVAGWAVDLPLATVPWPSGLAGLGLLAVTAAVVVIVLRRRAWRVAALTVAGAALVAVLVARPLVGSWPPDRWLMIMCDVGQGDGMIVAAGAGQGVVVDTGPDPIVMDKCLRIARINDIPLLVLTHPHADHVDGLPGALRNRRVGAVVISSRRTNPQASARISADLARRRIPEWAAAPGTTWRFGPSEVSVVAPEAGGGPMHGQGEGSTINNASVVLWVRWRAGSMLFGGDLETEAQDELLRRHPLRADILKTPHHGSNRQSPDFLASLGARAALISVGADNDYGHPAPSTLALLRRIGATPYRTDRSGDLAVVERDGGLAVVARGDPRASEVYNPRPGDHGGRPPGEELRRGHALRRRRGF